MKSTAAGSHSRSRAGEVVFKCALMNRRSHLNWPKSRLPRTTELHPSPAPTEGRRQVTLPPIAETTLDGGQVIWIANKHLSVARQLDLSCRGRYHLDPRRFQETIPAIRIGIDDRQTLNASLPKGMSENDAFAGPPQIAIWREEAAAPASMPSLCLSNSRICVT